MANAFETTPAASGRNASPHRDLATPLVWGLWLLYSLALLAQVALYGVSLPKYDEWGDIVPVFDGSRPFDFAYLWTPNFGHRLLLSRLVQHGLLRLSHGDFRACMYFNAVCLILAALVLLLALRRSRPDGRTVLADIAVPLILLSWTHYDNVLWSYQVQYLLSVLFLCCLIGIVLTRGDRMDLPTAAAVGVLLLLLPVCGMNGLVFVPLTAVWLAVRGIRQGRKGAALVAIAAVALTFSLVCLTNPQQGAAARFDPAAVAETVIGFLSLGFGVAGMPSGDGASRLARISDVTPLLTVAAVLLFAYLNRTASIHRRLAAAALFALLALSSVTWLSRPLHAAAACVLPLATILIYVAAYASLLRAWRLHPESRGRTEGLAALLTSALLLTAAIGLGRGTGEMSPRYATLAAMPLIVLYAALTTEARSAAESRPLPARFALATLVALVAALAPANFNRIRANIGGKASTERATLQTMRTGVTLSRLVAMPVELHMPSSGPDDVLGSLTGMKRMGIAPYAEIKDDPAPADLIEVDPAIATGENVTQQESGAFTGASLGGTLVLPLPHSYDAPLVRIRYAYVRAKVGDEPARLGLRTSGGSVVAPTRPELNYQTWGLDGDVTVLTTTDATVDALVIRIPPTITLRVKQVTVWRQP